ncbi:MAG: sporulation protein [Lachnospiraceae bacterium]|nr:sporulation protein [Lachnospiraceae bacterium]
MAEYKVNEVIDKLLEGTSSFLNTKTVVGQPVQCGETTIIPLVDIFFGVGGRNSAKEKKDMGCAAVGGKMTPSAVLVINKGSTKVINIKNQDAVNKLLDFVPDIVNRFTEPKAGSDEISNDQAIDIAFDKSEN